MESITHLIKSGLLKDLHIAERSFLLNKKISESQKDFSTGTKADISKILFDLTYTEMVLSLCRLYDTPNKRYPTRCLKQLYEAIKSDNYQTDLKESKTIILQECKLIFYPDLIELLESSSTHDFNKRTVTFLDDIKDNEPVSSSMKKLKEIRDKLLAHNEDIPLDTYIPYESVSVLINYAKHVLSFFSIAYSGIRLTVNGFFYLSNSAFDWEIKYNRFLSQ